MPMPVPDNDGMNYITFTLVEALLDLLAQKGAITADEINALLQNAQTRLRALKSCAIPPVS